MPTDHDLLRLEQSVKRTSRWVLIVLVVFVLVLVGGGAYVYYRAEQRLAPEKIVARALKKLQDRYPEIRREVKKKATTEAPRLAEKASREALKQFPDLRMRLEDFLKREIDTGMNRVSTRGKQLFRKFLRANREKIKAGFADLRKAPTVAPQFAAMMEPVIDKELGTDIRRDAREALAQLRRLNDHLERLAKGDNLGPQEQTERHILRLLRALQVQKRTGTVTPE